MPAIVTNYFRLYNATQFLGAFEEGDADTGYIYLFIGKCLSWVKTHAASSDTNAPTPDGDVSGNSYEPWREMLALKRVTANTDATHAAKRTNWTSGTFYSRYDDQDPYITKDTTSTGFYVYDSAGGHAFKCLDNAGGSPSTVKPTKPSAPLITKTFTTSDGYRWKYMFTLSGVAIKKFLTTSYIPVRTLSAGEVSGVAILPSGYDDQQEVQKWANAGSIEAYSVMTAGGSGEGAAYGSSGEIVLESDRQIVTISSNTSIVLKVAAGELGTDLYNGAAIYVANSKDGAKGIATISDWDISTRILTLESPGLYAGVGTDHPSGAGAGSDPKLVIGDTYHIGPRIEVQGDGQKANAYSIGTTDGKIKAVYVASNTIMSMTGNGYTFTTLKVHGTGSAPFLADGVTVNPNAGDLQGSGAQVRAILPPPGGHGYNPVHELNAWRILLHAQLLGAGQQATESGNTFPIVNEYRQVGLIRNPHLSDKAIQAAAAADGLIAIANTTPLFQTTKIVANTTKAGQGTSDVTPTWTPSTDEVIEGVTSGATGVVVEYNSHGDGVISVTNITPNSSGGTFHHSEKLQLASDPSYFLDANGFGPAEPANWAEDTVITPGQLKPATGEILYIENRAPITRSTDQSEDIRIVIEF